MNDKKRDIQFGRADLIAGKYGESLIGLEVLTEAIGDYPGGWAPIVEVAPDLNAPEIVFNVRHPTEGVMGVFEYEHVGRKGSW